MSCQHCRAASGTPRRGRRAARRGSSARRRARRGAPGRRRKRRVSSSSGSRVPRAGRTVAARAPARRAPRCTAVGQVALARRRRRAEVRAADLADAIEEHGAEVRLAAPEARRVADLHHAAGGDDRARRARHGEDLAGIGLGARVAGHHRSVAARLAPADSPARISRPASAPQAAALSTTQRYAAATSCTAAGNGARGARR